MIETFIRKSTIVRSKRKQSNQAQSNQIGRTEEEPQHQPADPLLHPNVRAGSKRTVKPGGTTGRKRKPGQGRAVALVARSLRVLEWFAPNLALAVAARLFVSPPTVRADPWSRRRTKSDGAIKAFDFVSRGRTVRAYRSGTGPLVLLVHGWGGRAAQFSELTDGLVRAGFSTVSVDLPAHGASSGRTTNAFEMREALLELVARVGQPYAVVAHSFGALVTALGLREGLRPERCAMVAPMTSFRYAFDAFSSELALSSLLRVRLEEHLQRRFGISEAGMEIDREPPSFPLPLLVIHDSLDSRVPQHLSRSLVQAWPDAAFLPTTGLGHQRVLSDPDVVSAIVSFASVNQAV